MDVLLSLELKSGVEMFSFTNVTPLFRACPVFWILQLLFSSPLEIRCWRSEKDVTFSDG